MKTRKINRNLNYKFLSALPLIGIRVFLPQQSGKAMIRRFATSITTNTTKFFYTSNGTRIPINKPSTTTLSKTTITSTTPSSNTTNNKTGTKFPLFSSTGNNSKNVQASQKASSPKTNKSSLVTNTSTNSTSIDHKQSTSSNDPTSNQNTKPKMDVSSIENNTLDSNKDNEDSSLVPNVKSAINSANNLVRAAELVLNQDIKFFSILR